jgi:urease accessory protein
MSRILLAVLILMPLPALAHTGEGAHGFLSGVLHPLTGTDHLLAMFAVGLWAASLGGRAIWALPLAFVVALAAGGVTGVTGIRLPSVEAAILASLMVFGVAAAIALRLPLGAALAGTAVFGLAHGLAHGSEVTGDFLPFASGFVLASLGLHLAGLAVGRVPVLPRALGAGVAVAGVALAVAG